MSDLESVIRPSLLPDYAPAKTYYRPGVVQTPTTRVAFGKRGQGKIFNGSDSSTSSHYMTQYANEKKTEIAT